jgi:cytochrome b6-f complex iron-sulfur subunit
MDRKNFIKTCGFACLGTSAMAAILQSCATTNYFAKSTVNNKIITLKKTEFISIEKDKTIQRKYVLVKPEQFNFPICIFKLSDTEYSAVLMECTHSSCELHNQGDFLQCPCHGSEFSNKGIVQNPPAEHNLKTFLIKLDNENIYIKIS